METIHPAILSAISQLRVLLRQFSVQGVQCTDEEADLTIAHLIQIDTNILADNLRDTGGDPGVTARIQLIRMVRQNQPPEAEA